MKNGSRYVFGAAVAGVALGLPGLIEQAHAGSSTAALFTFESIIVPTVTGTSSNTAGSGTTSGTAGTTSAAFGPYMADSGVGTAFGSHASTKTAYSSPSGNGSARSLSANNFAAGDYFSFSIPTTSLNDLVFSFDQVSSATGPKAFTFVYSADGTNFTTFGSYAVAGTVTNTDSSGGTATASSFATASSISAFNHLFDLTSVTALNNDPLAVFRLVESDTTTATGGADRVDNVLLTADSVDVASPEPSSLVLTSVAAGGLLFRRRRSQA